MTDAGYRQALLTAALGYADRGWHIFPLRPGTKKPAVPNHPAHLCDTTDPKCAHGHTGWEARATTDADRIKRAWTSRAFGIGIAAGPSDLVVIDLDIPKTPGHKTGAERFDQLTRSVRQTMPRTFTVGTASGGTHLYYKAAPGPALTNTASRLGPYIDTRAAGGYIVAPPTRLSRNARYCILTDCDPVPKLPKWLASKLTRPQPPRTQPPNCRHPVSDAGTIDRYLNAALDGEVERIRTAPEGSRNNTLFIAAVALGQLVGAAALTIDDAHRHLLDAARTHLVAGAYNTAQAHKTIASGLHRGQQQPRQLPAFQQAT